MQRMKQRLMLAAAMVLFASAAFAQEAPPEPSLPKGFAVALLTGVPLIVAIGQILRKLPFSIPGWLKAVLPAVVGVLGSYVSNWAGVTVDLSPILGALLGTTANASFSFLKEVGAVKGSSG